MGKQKHTGLLSYLHPKEGEEEYRKQLK